MRKLMMLAVLAAGAVCADDKYDVLSPHFRGWIILDGKETWCDGDGTPATEAEKKEAHKKYEMRCWKCQDAPLAEIIPAKEIARERK